MPTNPSSRPQHRTAVIAALAAAVALTACSTAADGTSDATSASVTTAARPPQSAPGGGTDVPTTGVTATAPSTAADESTTTATAPTTTVAESPLAEYVAGGSARPITDFDPVAAERETRAHEEAIARCMADEGFDYRPFVRQFQWYTEGSAVAIVTAGAGTLPNLPPDQFATQYGYGLSTRDPNQVEDSEVDPNAAIVDAMPIAQRVAYYHALLGADQSLDDEGRPNAEMPGDPASCWEQAATEVWGDQSGAPATDPVLAAFAPLLDQIAAIEDQIAADPRMVAAHDAWSACMADAGFPGYTDLNGPQSTVAARARDVMGTAMDPASADPDELAELQRFEIAIATADNSCREEFGEAYTQVRNELETRFVEQHRTELEQYRDAVAANAG
jgi:hypothetical protein